MPNLLSRLLSPWIVGVALGSFYFALGMAVPQYRSFQEDSEGLLAKSAARAAQERGVWQWGGFMHHAELNRDLIPESTPYYSQNGLHFKVLAWVTGFMPNRSDAVHRSFQFVAAMFTGFVLAWFIAAVHRDHGPWAALVVLMFVASSSPLIAFASKAFWMEALLLLPFVYSYARYDQLRSEGRLGRFYGMIALLILLKSLCGYEYLSSVLLAAMTPQLYHELAAGSHWRLIVRRMALTFAAGVAGFVLAYTATFVQAYLFLGSAGDAIQNLIRSAGYNTLGDHHGRQVPLVRTVARFFQYFLIEGQAQIIIFTLGAFVVYWVMVRTSPRERGGENRSGLRTWGATLAFAFLASLSWNALAHGHMRGHIQINFITFYLPFNLIAYAFFGMLIQFAIDSVQHKPASGQTSGEMEVVS